MYTQAGSMSRQVRYRPSEELEHEVQVRVAQQVRRLLGGQPLPVRGGCAGVAGLHRRRRRGRGRRRDRRQHWAQQYRAWQGGSWGEAGRHGEAQVGVGGGAGGTGPM